MFYCARGELEAEQNCNILIPTLMAITAFLSRSPGLLNRGPEGPASAGTCSSFQHLFSNWLDFLSPGLYNNLTPTLLPISHPIQLVRGQRHILIFLDRMHLLFTSVLFVFWQLGWVGGQYTTQFYTCVDHYILTTQQFGFFVNNISTFLDYLMPKPHL